jgi:hypothetical protein
LQKSTEVMTLVNKLMKAPQVAATMQDLSKEMMKVCVTFLGIGVCEGMMQSVKDLASFCTNYAI